MLIPNRFVLVLALAASGAAVAVSGCGNDVPPNAVAKVGDTVVRKSDFNKWLGTAARGQSQGSLVVVPDPPDFKNCVAQREKQKTPKGATKPSPSELKKQCQQEFDQLKGQVMQFLIQAQWVQQEAKAQDVTVSDAEVKRAFEDQKKTAFPGEKGDARYRRFLQTSGMSEQDILFRVKLDELQNKLTQKVTENQGKVTDADVRTYYAKNKTRFAQPERRDLRVVLTKTKARAARADKALRSHQSWAVVAKKYSIDPASRSQGGRLPDVAKGQQEKALDTAVFSAPKGKLEGPVKTQFGWYVFEVTKITPASQQSLSQAQDTIRNLLRSQRQQKALDDFVKGFRDKYRGKTTCADGYKVSECKNGPKEKTQTGPTPGGAQPSPEGPSGGAQPSPQAPPGGATQGPKSP
jgi:foldase protein PrsA